MELCDVVDEFGTRTGRVIPRGTPLAPGEFHPVVHVWIRDEKGAYLIQQRAAHLESDPGVWATTMGYVLAGEESLSAAMRETSEELGLRLSPAQLSRFGRLKTEYRIEDLWLAEVSREALGSPKPGPDVADWKWVSKSELEQMLQRGDFIAYNYLKAMPE